MAEHLYPSFPHSKPCSLSSFNFNSVQTSRSRGQHLCSKFAEIPHLGWPRTFKAPTSSHAPPPPSGITYMYLSHKKRNMKVTLFWCRPHCFCRVNQDVLMLTSWNLRETGLFVKCCDLSWEVNSRTSLCNIWSDWKQNKVFSKIFYGNELCFLYITWKLAKF